VANAGDAIEIGPGTLTEDGVRFVDGVPVSIRGSGVGVTVIDGGGFDSPGGPILDFEGVQQSGTRISDLTLRNGRCAVPGGGGAVAMSGSGVDVFFERVAFEDNAALDATGGGAHVRAAGDATVPLFINCTFTGGTDAFASLVFETGADPIFVNAFIDASSTPLAVEIEAGLAQIVNSTVVGAPVSLTQSAGSVEIVNSVLTEAPDGPTSPIVSIRSVYPGSPDPALDGVPVFVDELNGDFRLASGRPGVDAGDYTEYVNRGGTFFDAAGVPRFFDDPRSINSGGGSPIDVGAFELEASGDRPGCNIADIASNFGVLDLADIDAFILAFLEGCP